MERMLGGKKKDANRDDGEWNAPASRLLAMKLLPTAMASTLCLCESLAAAPDAEGATGRGSEFSRFVLRRVIVVAS